MNHQKQDRRPAVLLGAALLFGIYLLWSYGSQSAQTLPQTIKAVAYLQGNSKVAGIVTFIESTVSKKVTVEGSLTGLDPRSLRGFHIHQFGNLTDGCLSTGSHFNPFGRNHGAPTDDVRHRHVGDLGNIQVDDEGKAIFILEDSLIRLTGPTSIVGRAVVVHAGTDDLGTGKNEESLKTGNAGGRAACGVIGLA